MLQRGYYPIADERLRGTFLLSPIQDALPFAMNIDNFKNWVRTTRRDFSRRARIAACRYRSWHDAKGKLPLRLTLVHGPIQSFRALNGTLKNLLR